MQDTADEHLGGPGRCRSGVSAQTGFADYLLYADRQAIGVVEAKPEGHTLTGVETQSRKYTEGLPKNLPALPPAAPFAYESTGAVTQFTNTLEPDARSREVFTFHRPEELIRLVKLDKQVRTLAAGNAAAQRRASLAGADRERSRTSKSRSPRTALVR